MIKSVVREEMQSFGVDLKNEIIDAVKDVLTGFRNDMVSLKDEIVGELKTNREEQTMLNGRTMKINNIESRVEKLEKIHPQGTHQPFGA